MKSLGHTVVAAVVLLCPVVLFAERAVFKAGDLELGVANTNEGIEWEHLVESSLNHELLAKPPLPLFTVVARQAGSSNDLTFNADAGWSICSIKARARHLDLNWSRHTNAALQGISVHVAGTADARASAIHWTLKIVNTSKSAGLWRVTFPQVSLADLGTNAAVFFPRGPGEVQRGVWSRPFTYHGKYPEGWGAMQFMAAYVPDPGTGLYVATHDPWGSTKELLLKAIPGRTPSASVLSIPRRIWACRAPASCLKVKPYGNCCAVIGLTLRPFTGPGPKARRSGGPNSAERAELTLPFGRGNSAPGP